jgi:uracil-DNA glycosylase
MAGVSVDLRALMAKSLRLPVVADALARHQAELRACRACPEMIGPVITGGPVVSPVYLVGQAPGVHEGEKGQPFSWTAGKRLFSWFATIGLGEEAFRARAHMAAVCRCFPGKAKGGGDRVPAASEIEACSRWMAREVALLQPRLVIPVGRLAIEQILPAAPLAEQIGRVHRATLHGHACDVIPLPHPSGASTWFKREPGRGLTEKALALIARHEAWKAIVA